jgi:hypothetical protein
MSTWEPLAETPIADGAAGGDGSRTADHMNCSSNLCVCRYAPTTVHGQQNVWL